MNDILVNDEFEDAIDGLSFLGECLQSVAKHQYRWKWAIVLLHAVVEDFMILALSQSRNVTAIRKLAPDDHADRPQRQKKPYDFMELYKNIKSDSILLYAHSERFQPAAHVDRHVKKLNEIRNLMVNISPKGWEIELAELPAICLDALSIVFFLGWESGNIIWKNRESETRAKDALVTARMMLEQFQQS